MDGNPPPPLKEGPLSIKQRPLPCESTPPPSDAAEELSLRNVLSTCWHPGGRSFNGGGGSSWPFSACSCTGHTEQDGEAVSLHSVAGPRSAALCDQFTRLSQKITQFWWSHCWAHHHTLQVKNIIGFIRKVCCCAFVFCERESWHHEHTNTSFLLVFPTNGTVLETRRTAEWTES